MRGTFNQYGFLLYQEPEKERTQMPRKTRDKELAVLDYFETADLGAARLVLKLARAKLDRRTPQPTAKKADAAPSVPKKRVGSRKLQDVPLPGVQETVG